MPAKTDQTECEYHNEVQRESPSQTCKNCFRDGILHGFTRDLLVLER